jgi:hypothetical protein
MGVVADGFKPPLREELGDLDETEWGELNGRPIDPWQKTNNLLMCDSDGTLYTFVTASKGGLSAIGELSEAYSHRRRMKPDEIPVVELLARSYIHKDYGETFAPKLRIVGWTPIPDNLRDVQHALLENDNSDDTLSLEQLMTGNGAEPEPVKPTPRLAPAPRLAAAAAKPAPVLKATPVKSVAKAPVKPAPKSGKKASVRF